MESTSYWNQNKATFVLVTMSWEVISLRMVTLLTVSNDITSVMNWLGNTNYANTDWRRRSQVCSCMMEIKSRLSQWPTPITWKIHMQTWNYREKINGVHSWKICRNLNVIAISLGLLLGYTKYSCFLWDSRDKKKRYTKGVLLNCSSLTSGRKKVLFPYRYWDLKMFFCHHCTLNLVKAMDKVGEGYFHLKPK